MTRPIRVLFENGPDQKEPLRVTSALVEAAFSLRPGLRERIEPVISDSVAGWSRHVAEVPVIFLGRHIRREEAPPPGSPLRWVQSISAGVESHLAALPEGVVLTNASGVHAAKGGEFLLAAALMLNFHVPRFASDKLARRWAPAFGGPLAGKRVTLLGTGAIGGSALAPLQRQGARVAGANRTGTSDLPFERVVGLDGLDALLAETDFLLCSLPLTPQTRGLMDARRIGLLPSGAGVANVGRSRVFDSSALRAALESGHLSGAVLDVFDTEPLPADDPMWTCPNAILTPHCSLDDHETYLRACLDLFAENLERYLAGKPLKNVVDRSAGY